MRKLPLQEVCPLRSRSAAEAHAGALKSVLRKAQVRGSVRVFKRSVRVDGERVPVFVVIARWPRRRV